jgi:hypothetical protein
VVDAAQRVVVPDEVLVRRLPTDELMLLHLRSERYFGLNGTGARMWEALTTTERIGQAVTVLQGEFDVSLDELQADLDELIGDLVSRGLLELYG